MTEDLTTAAQAIFSHDRFATELVGVEIVSASKHSACCRMSVGPQHRNAMGGVMGAVFFTLADLAFAAAANSDAIAVGQPIAWVSADSHIAFLRNTAADQITAIARCVRQGHTSCVYTIEIQDPSQTMLAIVTTTGIKKK